jgi:hypothetical protein
MQQMIIVDNKSGRIIAEAWHDTEGILAGYRWRWITETVADWYRCHPNDVAPLGAAVDTIDTEQHMDGLTVGLCHVARTLTGKAAQDYAASRLTKAAVERSLFDTLFRGCGNNATQGVTYA